MLRLRRHQTYKQSKHTNQEASTLRGEGAYEEKVHVGKEDMLELGVERSRLSEQEVPEDEGLDGETRE